MGVNINGITLDRSNGIPLYVQLKTQIKERIKLGYWLPGQRVPTERELAEALGISRNTVSCAYRELELEGILRADQGRGTFVTGPQNQHLPEEKRDRLLRVIDLAIEEAVALNFHLDEFLTIALEQVERKKEFLQLVQVAFVTNSHEHCQYFIRQLEPRAGISIIPVLLSQLQGPEDAYDRHFANVDLIVTTFFYLEEVQDRLGHLKKPILGIALNLSSETIVELARIPSGQKVGLVSRSAAFAKHFQQFLANPSLGLPVDLVTTQATESRELQSFCQEVDIVAVSWDRAQELTAIVGAQRPIIELRYRPDLGSINLIKLAILELQENPGD